MSRSSAVDSGFGLTFYQEDVVLVQRDVGSSEQFRGLLENWPGCE